MDKEMIETRLILEFDYTDKSAKSAAIKLINLAPELQASFQDWWQNGEIMEVQVGGYSIQNLVNQYHLKIPAAFITLDWLLRDPHEAKKFLKKGIEQTKFS